MKYISYSAGFIRSLAQRLIPAPTETPPSITHSKSELIAERAMRVCNRKKSLVGRYKAVHAVLAGGA